MRESFSGNREQRNKKFIDMLNHLQDNVFDLSKIDKNTSLYRVLSETQLAYTYIEIVMQCKMRNETAIAEYLGRPSFLWSENQLLAKLKRKHTFKSVPLYLKRIEYLIQMGFIKRVLFEEIDSAILKLVDKEKLVGKPDLYIMVDVSPTMVSKIPFQNIDFDSINLLLINQKEKEEKLQKNKELKKELLKTKITKKISSRQNPQQDIPSTYSNKNIMENHKNEQSKSVEFENDIFNRAKELINYNLRVINEDFEKGLFSSINDYIKKNQIKLLYIELLKKQSVTFNHYLLNFKNKLGFYIEKEEMAKLYQEIHQKPITSRNAKKLFDLLCEIGFLKKVSAENLIIDLGMNKNEFALLIKEKGFNNFSYKSEIYFLLRLNNRQLIKIHNKISVMNETERERVRTEEVSAEHTKAYSFPEKTVKKEIIKKPIVNKENNRKAIDLSITECALDILIESKIEGNKVIIDKHRFDKLIESILGEVPPL